jgi:hypothetical protein
MPIRVGAIASRDSPAVGRRDRPRAALVLRASRTPLSVRSRAIARVNKIRTAIARAIRSVSRRRARTHGPRAPTVVAPSRARSRVARARRASTRVDGATRGEANAIVEAARVDARVASVGAASRDAARDVASVGCYARASGDAMTREGDDGAAAWPRPSATLVAVGCAALALACLGDGTRVATSGLLGGASTTARGDAGRERVLDDVPFEDDHVRLVVPRVERDIAAEELRGEVSWTRAATTGVFDARANGGASATNGTEYRPVATYAALGRRRHHGRKHHRYDDDEEELAYETKGDDFELPELSSVEPKDSKKKETETFGGELTASEVESILDKLRAQSQALETGSDATSRLGAKEASTPGEQIDELEKTLARGSSNAANEIKTKKSSLLSSIEEKSKDLVEELDSVPAQTYKLTFPSPKAPSKDDKARDETSTADADAQPEANSEISRQISSMAKGESDAGDAAFLKSLIEDPETSELMSESMSLSSAQPTSKAPTPSNTPLTPSPATDATVLGDNGTTTSPVDIPTKPAILPDVVRATGDVAKNTTTYDDASDGSSHEDLEYGEGSEVAPNSKHDDAESKLTETAQTGEPAIEYKKKIDTTNDINLYENALRGEAHPERSWAQKGLKPADESVLTEENIKQNELAEEQSLTVDFLNRFPVQLPKSERETQNWRRYQKLRTRAGAKSAEEQSEEDRETVERVTAAAVELVRAEKKGEDDRKEKSWRDVVFSLYFMGPLGFVAFVSVFYAVVVLVVRKSKKSPSKTGTDPDDDEAFDKFLRDVTVTKSKTHTRRESDGGLASFLGFVKKRVDDVDEFAKYASARLQRTVDEDGEDDVDEEQVWHQSTVSASGLESTSISGTSTPRASTSASSPNRVNHDPDRVLDKAVVNRSLQSIRTRELSSPERIRNVRSREATADPSPATTPRETSYLTQQTIDRLEPERPKQRQPQSDQEPPQREQRERQSSRAKANKPSPQVYRSLFPREQTEPPPAPPRRPGDAPQIVRSMTTKFY